jgi:hypothetical protein
LICTDPDLPLEDLLQEYVWRWDIEVNHRDEKTILGVAQAQARNENSVEYIPATAVAANAMRHFFCFCNFRGLKAVPIWHLLRDHVLIHPHRGRRKEHPRRASQCPGFGF